MAEAEKEVVHPKKNHLKEKYHEIYLLIDKEPVFIQYEDWKAPEKEIKKWYNLGLFFFFKKAS